MAAIRILGFTMISNDEQALQSLEKALSESSRTPGAEGLLTYTIELCRYLQATELTRPRLPEDFYAMGVRVDYWRTRCLQGFIGRLEAAFLEEGRTLIGEAFWLRDYPQYLEHSLSHLDITPAIAPSRVQPAQGKAKNAGPTALRASYQLWVGSELLDKLDAMAPWMPHLGTSYEPDKAESFRRFGLKLSAATSIQTAQALNLTFHGTAIEDALGNCVLRRQAQADRLWPDDKEKGSDNRAYGRSWAELQLKHILRQILIYDPDAWGQNTHMHICISNGYGPQLKDVTGKNASTLTQLHYWHTRLAVASEEFWRTLQFLEAHHDLSSESTPMIAQPSSNLRLPAVIQPLAKEMQEVLKTAPDEPSVPPAMRFQPPAGVSLQTLPPLNQTVLKTPYCSHMPSSLIAPVLEGDELRLVIEPALLGQHVSHLECHFLLANPEGKNILRLEASPIQGLGSQHASPVHVFRLKGRQWLALKKRLPPQQLAALWEENALFAVKRDVLGTGFILVGMIMPRA